VSRIFWAVCALLLLLLLIRSTVSIRQPSLGVPLARLYRQFGKQAFRKVLHSGGNLWLLARNYNPASAGQRAKALVVQFRVLVSSSATATGATSMASGGPFVGNLTSTSQKLFMTPTRSLNASQSVGFLR
jgi:hypothetical protein